MAIGDGPAVVRDIVQVFGGREFRLITRLDHRSPTVANISAAHCLAFSGPDIVLALHATRDWTIPGGHMEPGESPEQAMAREAEEEAGITVADEILFAHEEIDPLDGVAASSRYTVPSFQVFYVARLVSRGPITTPEECTESRLFAPDQARAASGWIQRNGPVYEAALSLALSSYGAVRL